MGNLMRGREGRGSHGIYDPSSGEEIQYSKRVTGHRVYNIELEAGKQ